MALCLPDEGYNAIACSIFTFDNEDGQTIKYYSWMNVGTTDMPKIEGGKDARLKDQLWHDYRSKYPNLVINADQEMKITADGKKEIERDDTQSYLFVGAHTNLHWS